MGLNPTTAAETDEPEVPSNGTAFRTLAVLTATVAYFTILLGAWVTFTPNQGLSCPTWPGCLPSSANLIEFSHRVGALLLSIATLALFAMAHLTRQARPGVRRLTEAAAVLVLVQAAVGGAIIFSREALATVVFHLGLATLLFGILVLVATMASFPHLPPRWQRSLIGTVTATGRAREELERLEKARSERGNVPASNETPGTPSPKD